MLRYIKSAWKSYLLDGASGTNDSELDLPQIWSSVGPKPDAGNLINAVKFSRITTAKKCPSITKIAEQAVGKVGRASSQRRKRGHLSQHSKIQSANDNTTQHNPKTRLNNGVLLSRRAIAWYVSLHVVQSKLPRHHFQQTTPPSHRIPPYPIASHRIASNRIAQTP